MVAAAVRLDYTGDGYSDLLLRNKSTGALTLWVMQGNQILRRTPVAHLPYPWIVEAAGDFDGDGTSDILWRNDSSGQLLVSLMRDGASVGGGGIQVPDIKLSRSWKVDAIGDFDGDGREDIALARRNEGLIEILYMNGSKLVSHSRLRAPTADWLLVAAPDADGDGASELVWQNQTTLEARIESTAAPGKALPLIGTNPRWRVLGSGDFDGDGRQDLLVRSKEVGAVKPMLLNGARATLASFSAPVPKSPWELRGLGDFDGDGRADALWRHTIAAQLWLTAIRASRPRAGRLERRTDRGGEDED